MTAPKTMMLRQFLVVALFGLLALGAGIYLSATKEPLTYATVLKKPRQVSEFNFIDTHNKTFTKQSLKGHWSLVFFGFTNCPHMCPVTLNEVSHALQLLENHGARKLPEVLMVSLDPPRDGSDKLRRYVQKFNPKFNGVIGEHATIGKLARELGVVYMKVGKDKTKDYDIQHSGSLALFNPKGHLAGFFTYPHNANDLAHDLKIIIG